MAVQQHDPFITDADDTDSGKGYSPDKFYTASRDKKGSANTLRCDMPPSVVGKVGEIVAAKVIPQYRTSADFFRDSVVHRAQYLKDYVNDGRFSDIAIMLMIASEARSIRDVQSAANDALQDYEFGLSHSYGEEKRRALVSLRKAILMSQSEWFIDNGKRLIARFEHE